MSEESTIQEKINSLPPAHLSLTTRPKKNKRREMEKAIRCFACKNILIKSAEEGKMDKFGFGPYIDFLMPSILSRIKIRIYLPEKYIGLVCPNPTCGRVTWIIKENIEEI